MMKIGLGGQTLMGLLVLVALALPMQAAAGDQVPFKGSETGTFQLLGPCETGGLVVDVTGTGYATQLGRTAPTTGSASSRRRAPSRAAPSR